MTSVTLVGQGCVSSETLVFSSLLAEQQIPVFSSMLTEPEIPVFFHRDRRNVLAPNRQQIPVAGELSDP